LNDIDKRSSIVTSVTDILGQSVVVFSTNYLPISRINIKRAIILLVTDKAEPVDFIPGLNWEVRSANVMLEVPAHIRLKIKGGERGWKVPPVTRREILRRDKHTCQYCGSQKKLTIDHIIPRSQGGKHTWESLRIL
jgi:5-methylcytosine-specific restriction endonuclease McrA